MKYFHHHDLGISFAEFGAMLATRAMLEAGLLRHAVNSDFHGKEHVFNMNIVCKREGCGTVSCIGGTMALIMNIDPEYYVGDADKREERAETCPALNELFWPRYAPNDWDHLTAKQAVQAIDAFLHGAEHPWQNVTRD